MFNKQDKIENKIKTIETLLESDMFEWERNQLESKLYTLRKKYKPNVLWNSSEKGTYKKTKEVKDDI